jgi:hypothetical protein
MEQAKAGLLKKATLSEINKYSLKQLRKAACHRNRRKKEECRTQLESKKRPKTRHYGGTLNESSAAGLVRMFQEGANLKE